MARSARRRRHHRPGAGSRGARGRFPGRGLGPEKGTLALLPQVVRAVRCPVVAAGGVADAAGVAAARALGAAGVQVGTAYLLCPEAQTSAVHRQSLRNDAARHTALTTLFSGRPARGIVNRLMRELGPVQAAALPFPLAAAVAPLRARAESQGSGDYSPLWCGQNASSCAERPAAEITRALAAGWQGGGRAPRAPAGGLRHNQRQE
ncbi:MAG: nitronate monooxygenase [Rubrivivax sp.]|nr:nitronate monooxygenase [Rubrivivax sp.]